MMMIRTKVAHLLLPILDKRLSSLPPSTSTSSTSVVRFFTSGFTSFRKELRKPFADIFDGGCALLPELFTSRLAAAVPAKWFWSLEGKWSSASEVFVSTEMSGSA